MKERSIHGDVVLPAHHQATEIPQPGEGPFDFPAPLVAPQLAAILQRGLDPVLSVRANQLMPRLANRFRKASEPQALS